MLKIKIYVVWSYIMDSRLVRNGKDAVDANHPFTSMKLYDNSHYLCICPKTTFITLLPILRNLSKKTNYFSTLNT